MGTNILLNYYMYMLVNYSKHTGRASGRVLTESRIKKKEREPDKEKKKESLKKKKRKILKKVRWKSQRTGTNTQLLYIYLSKIER